MVAARLVVWRHGRTEWNATGRFQGQADIELDPVGLAQAAAAAPALAAMEPVRLVSSDLRRAYVTAQALAAVTGLSIETDARLREIDVGSWRGLTHVELDASDPERAAALLRGEDVRRSDTGETTSECAARAGTALGEIGAAAPDGTTVVVAMHGLSGRVGALWLAGFPVESWGGLAGMWNCAWLILEPAVSGGWRLRAYNQRVAAPVDDVVGRALVAFTLGDDAGIRAVLHPYLNWTEGGVTTRGRAKTLARLAGRAPSRPRTYELRDGQIYRWVAD